MTTAELQWRLIYAIIVAGKSAKFAEKVMGKFDAHRQKWTPFELIRILIDEDNLKWVLYDIRCGNYTKVEKALRALVETRVDLRRCKPENLETIHGIGPKTSRFFILWTRPGERYAALDVHVLRWMRKLGYTAPLATPNGKRYRELELAFLAEADKLGMTPGELDAKIWDAGSNYSMTQIKPKQ